MNFFACPILVMNLVFRHDEQEEEVMSWAEEVEEMQPSKSFASLFNSSFNSSPTLPRTPPTPWNPASKIGLTGLVTFDHAKSVHEVARHIPLDKLLLETDTPYFLPSGVSTESYRHTFSQPGHVVHVAAQVGNLRQ